MKTQILDINGSKKSDIDTNIFDSQEREDIVQKIVEIEKRDDKQLYAPYMWAGMETSASGNVKHNRHTWKTDRGRGMSRFPKKRMSDKGDRFVWVGAVSPDTRKGRRAHPPKLERKELKINKKEKMLALKSAIAMTSSIELIKKKYSTLQNTNIKLNLPLIIEDKILSLKSGDFFNKIGKILGNEIINVAIQDRRVRAGIGKMRSRKYKKNAGMLLVMGNAQDIKISGLSVKKVKELRLRDLWDNGTRLVIFTESSIKDIEERLDGKRNNIEENKQKTKKEK